MDLFIIGIIIIIPLIADIGVKSSYNKYLKIANKKEMTGQEVARQILDKNGLQSVYVVATDGYLTDHYDPTRKTVRLSKAVYEGKSISSMAIAAHECGHAIQDKDGYVFMRIRATLVPVVNFITYIGYFAAIISIFAGITGYLKTSLLIILAAIVFQLVTLPVEFDASNRAGKELEHLGLVDSDEKDQVKSVLGAAALTYVASLVSSVLNLLRIIIMISGRDD